MAATTSIGLDIGSVSVRALAVSRGKPARGRNGDSTLVVEAFGQTPLPPGATVGGVVEDERAVVAALRQLWKRGGFKSKSIRLAVAHQQVVVREVEIANLPAKELRRALPYQVRDVLPVAADQAVLDFYPLEEPGPRDTVRGLLVAAPRESVTRTVEAVEKAGLHVEQVDLACFAALRAVAAATPSAEAVLDIGANATLLVIHENGIPHMVRTVARGGDEITRLLVERLNLTPEHAEMLKRHVGTVERPGAAPVERDTAAAITEAIRPFVGEIRSSLSYYQNSAPDRQVGRLALVGGGSKLPGLAALLEQAVAVPTVTPDPLQYVGPSQRAIGQPDFAEFAHGAAVAAGLTLGAAS